AHRLKIMESRAETEMPQCLAHLWEDQFRLVAKTEQRFAAAEFFSLTRNLQHFVRCQRVCTGVARIATKCAVSTIVAAQICERNKNFARVCNHAWLESVASFSSGGQQFGQFCLARSDPATRCFPANWRMQFVAILAGLNNRSRFLCGRSTHLSQLARRVAVPAAQIIPELAAQELGVHGTTQSCLSYVAATLMQVCCKAQSSIGSHHERYPRRFPPCDGVLRDRRNRHHSRLRGPGSGHDSECVHFGLSGSHAGAGLRGSQSAHTRSPARQKKIRHQRIIRATARDRRTLRAAGPRSRPRRRGSRSEV